MEVKREKRKRRPAYLHSPGEIFDFFRPQGLVLDLGCGEGKHTDYLAGEQLTVIATDITAERLRNPGRLNFVYADGMRLPFRDGSFDTVFCAWVLEHLPDPESCVKEVHRVLRRAGMACFATPCLNIPLKILVPIYRRLAGFNADRAREQHLHVFSARGLLSMLEPFFQITSVRYTDFNTVLQRRMGIGYNIDRLLSIATAKISPLHYLAASVLISCIKPSDS